MVVVGLDHYEVLCLPSDEEGATLSLEQIEKAYKTHSLSPFLSPGGDRTSSCVVPVLGNGLTKQTKDLDWSGSWLDMSAHLGKMLPFSCILSMAYGAPQDGVKTDKSKILKVSWEGGAEYYTAAKLEEIFKQFGKVEDIVIKTRKSRSRGSAIVVMASKEAAQSGLENHSVYNVFSAPLIVAPMQESSGVPAKSTLTPEARTSNVGGTGFSDLEASVFGKSQEAQKRKQSG
ncbi:hypothetical protein ABZP36_010370 [Zizania latifolia]